MLTRGPHSSSPWTWDQASVVYPLGGIKPTIRVGLIPIRFSRALARSATDGAFLQTTSWTSGAGWEESSETTLLDLRCGLGGTF